MNKLISPVSFSHTGAKSWFSEVVVVIIIILFS